MSLVDRTQHIAKFGGNIWYINKGSGSNTNSGKRPDQAFETIGAGITAMADGDALNITAGTYVEEQLNLSNDYAEMWFEIGALIDPAANTALTISGASCKLLGNHKITPAASTIGVLVTGNECVIENGKVLGGATGYSITGQGIVLNDCASGLQTTTAFDLQGIQGRLYRCKTVGNAATIGYKINNNVDTGVLENCTSVGHQTAGFSIATGSKDWTIVNCSSGAGDGRWVDTDHANVWNNFSYDKVKVNAQTLSGNNATVSTNLFQFYGSVVITDIQGVVETQLGADVDDLNLNIYDGTNTVQLSATGLDVDAAPVGSLFHKISDADVVLSYLKSDACRIYEDDSKYGVDRTVVLNAKAGVNNYIRSTYATTDTPTSGKIHWHIAWCPISDDGFVKTV